MKFINYLNLIITPGFKQQETIQYQLIVNDLIIPKLKIVTHTLHLTTYNLLRKFKKPQYHTAYLMRKKQGFNTLFFQQNYDIIVCDRYGNVLKTFNNQPPGYISHYLKDSYFIYFMVVGSIKHHNINLSNRLILKRPLLNWRLIEDATGIK